MVYNTDSSSRQQYIGREFSLQKYKTKQDYFQHNYFLERDMTSLTCVKLVTAKLITGFMVVTVANGLANTK